MLDSEVITMLNCPNFMVYVPLVDSLLKCYFYEIV
jgi:hypothetical protein